MPNHVTHRIIVTGAAEAVARFKETFIVSRTEKNWQDKEETYVTFDFNVLVPMPVELEGIPSSSLNDTFLLLVGRPDIVAAETTFGTPKTLEEMLSYAWVAREGITTVDGLEKHLKEQNPDWEKLGQQLVAAYEATGHTNWYSWCIENWGTKWNAYSFEIASDEPERLEFTFDTAWSSPVPIWEALAGREEMKGLVLTFIAFDEGWNFAALGAITNRKLDFQEVKATAALYEHVYGEPYVPYEEEDEAAE